VVEMPEYLLERSRYRRAGRTGATLSAGGAASGPARRAPSPTTACRRWGLHSGGEVAGLDLGGAVVIVASDIGGVCAVTEQDRQMARAGFGGPGSAAGPQPADGRDAGDDHGPVMFGSDSG